MVQDDSINGNAGLYVRTIQTFPEHFKGKKTANVVRATRWWACRNKFCNEDENANSTTAFSCSRSRLGQRKRMLMKAAPGRGTKRSEMVMWLYPQFLDAFDMFRKIGVKFSFKLLIELALLVLLDPTSIYTAQSRDPKDNRLLIEKLNHSWVQRFMDVHNIVLLSQCGKLNCSPGKEIQIEMQATHHLGVLQRGFQTDIFDKNLIENIDETHFVVNMDNGRTLGFRGDTTMKYADVVSGDDSMTMVIRISGGRRSVIEAPMLIFTNGNSRYPIQGLDDNIPGVFYRTEPKGWMDQALFPEYFLKPRAFQPDLHRRINFIWIDNCSNHRITPRLTIVLTEKQIVLRFLPPCCTHLCQSADTFIISKIKDAWTERWEIKKTELIQADA
jgi:hypothetical protein